MVGNKKKDGRVTEATLPIRTVTHLGARVAPQQSPILPVSGATTTTFSYVFSNR